MICLFSFLGLYERWLKSIIASYVMTNTVVLFAAELLSIIGQYNAVGCLLFLLSFMGVFCFAFRERLQKGFSVASKTVNISCKKDKIEILFAVFSVVLIIIAIIKVFLWPPQNGDSMTYHLPRSYMYWKNESIHNFPFPYKWGLYTGPFSAIVMSFLRIFSHGSDFLLGLIQLPGWVVAAFAAGLTGQKLIAEAIMNAKMASAVRVERINRIAFGIPFVLLMTLPLAAFQSSSTQCDLMGGCFTCISIYYLLQVLWTKEEAGMENILLCGLAVGLSVLTKINNVIPIFFMSATLLICGIKKYGKRIFKVAVSMISVAVLVNLGYWVRNAIDLNGDFLAISVSTRLGSSHMEPTAVNLICNIGYCFGSGIKWWAHLVDSGIRFAVRIFTGFDVQEGFSSFGETRTFDFYPYGIHMVAAFLSIVYVIITAIRKKNHRLLMYVTACIFSFALVAVSVSYTVSISRYMLGSIFIAFPVVGYVGGILYEKISVKKYGAESLFRGGIIICGILLFVTTIQKSMTASHGSVIYGMNMDYNILRKEAYWHLWDNPEKAIMTQIYAHGFTNIGIQEDVIIGEYPVLNDLRDYPCKIQYVNTEWGSQYSDPDFYPDCIVYAGEKDAMPEYLEYQGDHFWRLGETYYVWPGEIGLYIGGSE